MIPSQKVIPPGDEWPFATVPRPRTRDGDIAYQLAAYALRGANRSPTP